jgi:peptidoglycan/LPS O-acetylase OafA/YrhL
MRAKGGPVLAYMPQLDGLRAIAAIAVVLHHNLWRGGGLGGVRESLHLGDAGVRLFFVLSGFLITGILLRARGSPGALRAFYARRFLRIFPLYYAVVIGVALLGQPLMRATLGWNLAYLANFKLALLGGFPGPPISHLWTLSVEEQFYLLWPLLVLYAPRASLLPLALSTIVAAPASRLVLLLLTGNAVSASVVTTSCLDTLGTGALLAIVRGVPKGALPFGLGLLALVTALDGSWVDTAFRDTAYACTFAWVVQRAAEGVRGPCGRALAWRPLAYLGTISYGIYVFHHVLPALVRLPGYGLLRTGIVLLATIPIAALSFHFFEAPITGLTSRFPYRRAPRTPAPEPPAPVAA